MKRTVTIQATIENDNIEVEITSEDDVETSAVLLVATMETAKNLKMPVKSLLKRWLAIIAKEIVHEEGGTK